MDSKGDWDTVLWSDNNNIIVGGNKTNDFFWFFIKEDTSVKMRQLKIKNKKHLKSFFLYNHAFFENKTNKSNEINYFTLERKE